MIDENGREFKKIIDTAPGTNGMDECHLECGHIVFGRRPRIGAELRCKQCERLSERTDVGDNRKRVLTGRAA